MVERPPKSTKTHRSSQTGKFVPSENRGVGKADKGKSSSAEQTKKKK
jgi:hypothetical protein